MPTTYAHWRFGCDCIDTLPDELKGIIRKYRSLYDIGVHGPDIFFYDLKHKEVASYGGKLHHIPATEFFNSCVKAYKENNEDKDAMMAYIMGFLSHYALDSQCHPYIDKKDALTPDASHNMIEAYYDGHLMKLDGKRIPEVNRAKSLKPDRFTSRIIARFFPFDEETIYRTTKDQQLIISVLYCRTVLKRKALEKLLRKMGRNDHADLIIQLDDPERFRDSNLRLDKLTEYALELFPKLAGNLYKALTGDEKLLDYFRHDFDTIGGDETPVLSYQEELDYVPYKDID